MGDVDWKTDENGNLVVTWDAEARLEKLAWATFKVYGLTTFLLEPEEIESAGVGISLQFSHYDDFMDLMEPLVTNDSYDWIAPYQIGALTDGPLLGYGIRWGDEGDETAIEDVERIYYYNDYQIRSPMDDLIIYGQVTFTLNK